MRRRGVVSTCRRVTCSENQETNKKSALHHPSREGTNGGANEDVSWLRAKRLAFPGYPSGREPITACPLQWRGRAGFTPASVSPFAMSYALSLGGAAFRRNAQTSASTIPAARTAITYGTSSCARNFPAGKSISTRSPAASGPARYVAKVRCSITCAEARLARCAGDRAADLRRGVLD